MSPRLALKTGSPADRNTERLSHLAAHVLSLDHNGQALPEDGVWGRVFLQFSHQVDCVKAAAAAFGAAYELSCNHRSAELSSSALWHYGGALTRLRSAFAGGQISLESIAVASIILACAEILTQHEENALSHFLGAVQIMHRISSQCPGGKSSPEVDNIKDELIKIDVLIGSYGVPQTPQPTQFEEQEGFGETFAPEQSFRDVASARNAAMQCLYRTRIFTRTASQVRYAYPSWKGRDEALDKAQLDAAAQCRVVLEGLTGLVERLQTDSPATSRNALADIYGLRSQITATLVYILCAHDPFQTVYDQHMNLFQSIVSDGAASSRLKRHTKSSALKRFATRPGVIAPLFIVAMKCRDPTLRALATSLLKEQGREGPSDGSIAAAIGARVAELESTEADGSRIKILSASDVPERLKIVGHGVFPERLTSDGRRVLQVEFCRPKVPVTEGWGKVDYVQPEYWGPWKEDIEL